MIENFDETAEVAFGVILQYSSIGIALPHYIGNISDMVWNTPNNSGALSPTGKQGYGYTYDGLNRLTTANYGEGSNFATNAGANNVTITDYDRNGNIKGLTRQLKGTGEIEKLANLVTKCLNRTVGFSIFFGKKYLCPIVLMRFTRI